MLADSGINAKVPEHTWEEIVDMIIKGLKTGYPSTATCHESER